MDKEQYKVEVEKARQAHKDAEKRLNDLITNCEHEPISSLPEKRWTEWDYGYASCAICGSYLGDYCPTSPTKTCEYEEDDVCNDFCIHCELPHERK